MRGASLTALVLLVAASAGAESAPATASQLIDRHLEARWKEAGVSPCAAAEDAEFFRRASLDILGTLPSAEDVRRFLADARPGKRGAAIDELLARPGYAAYWAELWETLLLGYDEQVRTQTKRGLFAWLRDECFAKNMPYDKMVAAIVTAKGIDREPGPVSFLMYTLKGNGGPIHVTGRVTRLFLGSQIQCAQCHDHPFDRWTQEDFYGMVGFFARIQSRRVNPQDKQNAAQELFDSPKGDAAFGEGKQRKTYAPCFLEGLKPDAALPRRDEFARLLTRPENLQFPRAAVNRMWGHFFGRGLVHPVDDFNEKNRPSHPELIDALAREFVAHGYDLKWLIRAIAGTNAYGLSSRRPAEAPPAKFFTHALTRAMTPEQLANSILAATGLEGDSKAREDILRRMRRDFGDADSVDMVDFDGTIPQALLLMNGKSVNDGIIRKNSRLDRLLRESESPGERLEAIFLSVLSRPPTERERSRHLSRLERGGQKREAYEDVFWVLLNSSEFLFIH
jgi:hypothetical protein